MPDTHPGVPLTINSGQLRAIRIDLGYSQREFAELLRNAGAELGEPNRCTKRLVQKWEGGEHTAAMPNYQRALEHVTGVPYAVLCDRRPVAYATLPARLDRVIAELAALRADLDHLG